MSEATYIPNIDFLGRAFDIVETDPLDLGDSAKYETVVDITVAGETVRTGDGYYTIPAGVLHKSINSMLWETQSSVISSSYEFQQEFKTAVNAEAGVEGGFEFSASASQKEIAKRSESRNNSFVFSRAYQENHGLQLDLQNGQAPIHVTKTFAAAVSKLPVGEFTSVIDRYDGFMQRYGTHYTKEIILGGLAFQRTSGSSRKYLQSTESENELKAKASIEVDAVKAGAGAEQARREATSTDQQFALERTTLQFRGGDGSTSSIDSSWISSLHARPAIVKAKMERLSYLLTERFFPDDPDILDRGSLLDLAISDWIARKGTPSCCTAPLRYGEAVLIALPWNDNKTIQLAMTYGGDIQFPVRGGAPLLDGQMVAVRFENADGKRDKSAILAGDSVRLKVIRSGAYVAESLALSNTATPGSFTLLLKGDNPAAPGRLGDYLLETDRLSLMRGRPGAFNGYVGIQTGNRSLQWGRDNDPSVSFCFRRCDVSAN